VAHNKSYGRKRRARIIPKKMTPEPVNKIKQNLEEKWSPEQIFGRCPEYNISHTTIYTMIHKDQKLRKTCAMNEHTNGLVRQYLPKRTSFANLTQNGVQWIEDQLNHRPRKSLNFQTPHEAFFSTRTPVVHLKL
jgi:IS30 family transposase